MLSDFGVSRVVVASQVTTDTSNVKGSMRWMAFEFFILLNNASSPLVAANEKTDVWAFGMTVYVSHQMSFGLSITNVIQEILTGKRPFEDINNDVLVMLAIAGGSLPSAPDNLWEKPIPDQQLWNLCQKCWIKSPILRPLMEDIVAEIDIHLRGNHNSQHSVHDIRERASDVMMVRREDEYPSPRTDVTIAASDNTTYSRQDLRLPFANGSSFPPNDRSTDCNVSFNLDDSVVSDLTPRHIPLNASKRGLQSAIESYIQALADTFIPEDLW
jgi:serine/threonine protein kinase